METVKLFCSSYLNIHLGASGLSLLHSVPRAESRFRYSLFFRTESLKPFTSGPPVYGDSERKTLFNHDRNIQIFLLFLIPRVRVSLQYRHTLARWAKRRRRRVLTFLESIMVNMRRAHSKAKIVHQGV